MYNRWLSACGLRIEKPRLGKGGELGFRRGILRTLPVDTNVVPAIERVGAGS